MQSILKSLELFTKIYFKGFKFDLNIKLDNMFKHDSFSLSLSLFFKNKYATYVNN